MQANPLQYTITRMTIGPENSMLRYTQGGDDQAEQALIQYETQITAFFGAWAPDILGSIHDRYGPVADAGQWFETDLISLAVAARIGRGIAHLRLYTVTRRSAESDET